MGAPFIATEDKAYNDVLRQLSFRDKNDLVAWDIYPKEISDLASEISETLKSEKVWPSSIFLPDDPADIPFAIHFDFTDKLYLFHISMHIIEKHYKIIMDDDFWEKLKSISYVEALEEIIKKQNQRVDLTR